MSLQTFQKTGRFIKKLQQAAAIQFALLAVFLGTVIIISTGMGYIQMPPATVVKIIYAKLSGQSNLLEGMDSLFPVVVMDVRLPRILSAAIVGAGLAISGVVFQGILLNPLADPYTLGVSAGAAFGASLAILFNIGMLGSYSVPLFAFVGAVVTLLFVVYLSSSSGGLSSNNLILSGIIVAAILSAGISFLKYVADEQVAVIIFWLMGSFGSKTWTDVGLTFLFIFTGFLGGFTTFSTFGFELFLYIRNGQIGLAVLNGLIQLSAGLIFVWAGFGLSKAF